MCCTGSSHVADKWPRLCSPAGRAWCDRQECGFDIRKLSAFLQFTVHRMFPKMISSGYLWHCLRNLLADKVLNTGDDGTNWLFLINFVFTGVLQMALKMTCSWPGKRNLPILCAMQPSQRKRGSSAAPKTSLCDRSWFVPCCVCLPASGVCVRHGPRSVVTGLWNIPKHSKAVAKTLQIKKFWIVCGSVPYQIR